MLEFKNADVSAKYTSTFKGNPPIHYPGGTLKNGFKVKLASISLEQADRLFAMQNQNFLQLKTAAVKTTPPKGEVVKENKIP